MLNRPALLSDLQKLLKKLEADLLERSESAEVPEVGDQMQREFEEAKKSDRTAQTFSDWRSDAIPQMTAAWVLSGRGFATASGPLRPREDCARRLLRVAVRLA